MELVTLGKIVDSFGVDGTVKILSSTSFSKERYKKGNKVTLVNVAKNEEEILTVAEFRKQLDLDIVKFEEINSKEDALAKKNCLIKAEKDNTLLAKGEYYFSDLEGCKVLDQQGNELGTVSKVEEFPAQLTLRVKRHEEKDFFVPYIKQFILDVNINEKTIKIIVIEGML